MPDTPLSISFSRSVPSPRCKVYFKSLNSNSTLGPRPLIGEAELSKGTSILQAYSYGQRQTNDKTNAITLQLRLKTTQRNTRTVNQISSSSNTPHILCSFADVTSMSDKSNQRTFLCTNVINDEIDEKMND